MQGLGVQKRPKLNGHHLLKCRFMAPINAKEELPNVRDADATMALYQRVKRTVKQGIDEAQVRTHDISPWHCSGQKSLLPSPAWSAGREAEGPRAGTGPKAFGSDV